jgi:hypothetical protein
MVTCLKRHLWTWHVPESAQAAKTLRWPGRRQCTMHAVGARTELGAAVTRVPASSAVASVQKARCWWAAEVRKRAYVKIVHWGGTKIKSTSLGVSYAPAVDLQKRSQQRCARCAGPVLFKTCWGRLLAKIAPRAPFSRTMVRTWAFTHRSRAAPCVPVESIPLCKVRSAARPAWLVPPAPTLPSFRRWHLATMRRVTALCAEVVRSRLRPDRSNALAAPEENTGKLESLLPATTLLVIVQYVEKERIKTKWVKLSV